MTKKRNIGRHKIPLVLEMELDSTGQLDHWPLSEAHLLEEAEWLLWKIENEWEACGQWFTAYERRSLRKYAARLRAKGIEPKHDFEI